MIIIIINFMNEFKEILGRVLEIKNNPLISQQLNTCYSSL